MSDSDLNPDPKPNQGEQADARNSSPEPVSPEPMSPEPAPAEPASPEPTPSDVPFDGQQDLTAEISPESQETVQEFMAEAAQQNEAANEAVPDRRNQPGPYISFEHVYKSFGSLVVLEDVSFSVLPGETLCILGRSGVGKSVSLQILMGFLRADKGEVKVAGEDICGFNEKQLQAVRRKVTMVFQNGALFDSVTVGENVAFPLRERH